MFKDKSILISGGSSGLGIALAHALAAEGAQLSLLARDAAKLEAAADALRRAYPQVQLATYAANVTDASALDDVIAQIAARAGDLDILINNAGVMVEGYFESLTDADFRRVMDINFHGAVNLCRAALPLLKQSRGLLVNIASVAGLTGTFGYSAYCAAKHALVGFTECLQFELPPQGVQVHLVCPAEFASPMIESLDQSRTPENRAHTLTIPKVPVETIVNGTLDGIRRGKPMIVPGTKAWLATLGLRLFPGSSRKIGEQRVRSVYRGPASVSQ